MGKFMQPFVSFPVGKNRTILVSETYDGKISMAQQVTIIEDDGSRSDIVIKNSFLFTKEQFRNFVEDLVRAEIS